MAQLFDTLVCWLIWMVKAGIWAMIQTFNLVLKAFAAVINGFISLLPDMLLERPQLDQGLFGSINFFLPIGPLLAEFGIIMGCWAAYKAYRYLFRWVV